MQSTASQPIGHDDTNRALRRKDAAAFLGISEPTLDRWARLRTDFPAKLKLSANVTGYLRSELCEWLEAQREVQKC